MGRVAVTTTKVGTINVPVGAFSCITAMTDKPIGSGGDTAPATQRRMRQAVVYFYTSRAAAMRESAVALGTVTETDTNKDARRSGSILGFGALARARQTI